MERYKLTNEDIGIATESLAVYLTNVGMDRKEQIRTTFAVEEALLSYQAEFGEDVTFSLECRKRFGKEGFYLTVERVGSFNPFDTDNDGSSLLANNFLGMYGLLPQWKFVNGKNTISFYLPKKRLNPGINICLSVILAVLCYAVSRIFPQEVVDLVVVNMLTPTLSMLYGILTAISGPIIFCFIVYGICSMGDISVFESVGKKVVKSMLFGSVFYTVFSGIWFLIYYTPTSGSGGGGADGFFDIYQMILNFIPGNILSPIVDNQPIQIITLGVCTGTILLILQKSTPQLLTIVGQANEVFQYALGVVSSKIHIIVFFSIFQTLCSGNISQLVSTLELAVGLALVMLILLVVVIGRTSLVVKVSPITLIKKCKSTFFIALATSSSTAAFSDNIAVCKNKLGISNKIVDFGVPFGQVIYMPAMSLLLVVLGLYMSSAYDIDITYTSVCVLFFMSIVLSMAAPPIPGGSLTIMTILFTQLGIPSVAIAVATLFFVIFEFPCTASNITCLQTELLIVAHDMKMLDRDILKKNI